MSTPQTAPPHLPALPLHSLSLYLFYPFVLLIITHLSLPFPLKFYYTHFIRTLTPYPFLFFISNVFHYFHLTRNSSQNLLCPKSLPPVIIPLLAPHPITFFATTNLSSSPNLFSQITCLNRMSSETISPLMRWATSLCYPTMCSRQQMASTSRRSWTVRTWASMGSCSTILSSCCRSPPPLAGSMAILIRYRVCFVVVGDVVVYFHFL